MKRRFVIYFRAFTDNSNNSRVGVFLGKHHNVEFVEFELRNYRSYCQRPSVVIELLAEIVVTCELKLHEDVKAFTSIAIVKMCIQV